MDLTITGKNLEINDTIRKYVEKKIGRLDHYLPNIIDGRVELTVDEGARAAEDRQIAQVTLRTKKIILARRRGVLRYLRLDRRRVREDAAPGRPLQGQTLGQTGA